MKPHVQRSPEWPRVRAAHLARHPACAACGGTEAAQVHHLLPVHVAPARELDAANLLTLCEAEGRDCHLRVGHYGDWHDWNPHAVADAAALLAVRPRA